MTSAVTRQYQFPPAGLTAPPAEECSVEQLLVIATGACRSSSDLGALQGSPLHLQRLCALLEAFHKQLVEQEVEHGELLQRLLAAGRMLSGTRDQVSLVRSSLRIEVEAHRLTKQQLDQEHELRVGTEEELARDRTRLSRAMQLLSISLDRTVDSVDILLDLSGSGEATRSLVPAVDSSPDVCNEQTLVDAPDARCLADIDG